METILDKIIEEKKREVERLKVLGLPEISDTPKRSFISRLESAEHLSIIAEFKRASPSKGVISMNASPAEQAAKYVEYGADAISALTDTSFFKGSFEDLAAVRGAVDVPILCKDFMIDNIQIAKAKSAGADIILLIAAALGEGQMNELYHYASSLNLEVLVEVHNEGEAERAIAAGSRLIGVNNRDLRTFNVNLSVTERLAPAIRESGAFLISESGMKTIEDAKRAACAGAGGILVGETFMKAPDLESSLRGMKLPLKEVRIP
jgi:indole-3-glycerol phosphate synthase